jgi:8-oxo-dGTP pyrophosphatase MutT (NUDIX family)/DNA-binding XRE family transcriptional regulator
MTRFRNRPSALNHEPEAVTWARKKAGLTKRQLARQIGISEQLMGEIESGWRSATPANLIKIAGALNCPVVVLERKRCPTGEDPEPHPMPKRPGTPSPAADERPPRPVDDGSPAGAGSAEEPLRQENRTVAHSDTDFQNPGQRRNGGVWLILDEQDRALLVQPSYKDGVYHLVGGGAHPNEAPHLAAIREAHEEIGLTLVPDTLLITDWVPENPGRSVEGTNYVFFHRLAPGELDKIVLNAGGTPDGEDPELVDFRLLTDEELDAHCAPYMVRRVREAKAAVKDPALRGYRVAGQRISDAA